MTQCHMKRRILLYLCLLHSKILSLFCFILTNDIFVLVISDPVDIGFVIGYNVGNSREVVEKQKQLSVSSIKALQERTSPSLRAGFVTYSVDVNFNLPLSNPQNAIQELSRLSLTPGYGSLADALKIASGKLFQTGNNGNTPTNKMLTIFVVGKVTEDVEKHVQNLRDHGVVIKAIGISKDVTKYDLMKLANEEDLVLPGSTDGEIIEDVINGVLGGMKYCGHANLS